jgi:outer membrane protein OmpA-like peptidoglycan-associated protein
LPYLRALFILRIISFNSLEKLMNRMMKTTVAALAVVIGLAGCATNPYTGESKVSDTATGAGIGALVGAGTGALIGGGTGAAIGAGAGALVGGGVGYYMDQENNKLRQELVGTGVQVQKTPDGIKLVMSSDVTFATNSSDINSGFYPTLNSVAKVLKEYNKTNVVVSGFTDSTGNASNNQSLSERRAQSVSNYLAGQGVSGNRLFSQGFGARNPIASNATVEGRSANRRVEIMLRPK